MIAAEPQREMATETLWRIHPGLLSVSVPLWQIHPGLLWVSVALWLISPCLRGSVAVVA